MPKPSTTCEVDPRDKASDRDHVQLQAEIARQQQYIDTVHERLQLRGLLHDLQDSFGSPLSQQEAELLQTGAQISFRLGLSDATAPSQSQSNAAQVKEQEPGLVQPPPALELGKGVQPGGAEGSEHVDGPCTPKQVASSASPAKPGGTHITYNAAQPHEKEIGNNNRNSSKNLLDQFLLRKMQNKFEDKRICGGETDQRNKIRH